MRCKGCQETRQKRNIKHEREHHILHCLSFKINEGKDYKIYHKPLKHQQGIITVQTAGTALFICNGGAHGRGPLRQANSGRVTLLPLCHWGSVLPTRASPPPLRQPGRTHPAGSIWKEHRHGEKENSTRPPDQRQGTEPTERCHLFSEILLLEHGET